MTNNQKIIWRAQSCNFLTLKTYPKFIRIRSLIRPQRPSFTFHPCWGQKHILPPIPVKGAARVNPDGLKYMSWHGPSPHRQKKIFTLKYSFMTGKTTLTPPLKYHPLLGNFDDKKTPRKCIVLYVPMFLKTFSKKYGHAKEVRKVSPS